MSIKRSLYTPTQASAEIWSRNVCVGGLWLCRAFKKKSTLNNLFYLQKCAYKSYLYSVNYTLNSCCIQFPICMNRSFHSDAYSETFHPVQFCRALLSAVIHQRVDLVIEDPQGYLLGLKINLNTGLNSLPIPLSFSRLFSIKPVEFNTG